MAKNKITQSVSKEAFEKLRGQQQEQNEKAAAQQVPNRRYVGTKETLGFIIWDAAQSFNINIYSDRFITSIVGVDLGLQTIVNSINSVWDIINDIFFGAVVDKTRTRWGKFRPYLLFLAVPGCILTSLYWLMPHLFVGASQTDILKFVFYLVLSVAREGVTTFQTISRTGLMSTITPHPVDRTRLITLANFASGFFGEKLPEQAVTILIDVLRNLYMHDSSKLSKAYTNLFVGMGIFTTVASSASSFWFFYNSKERVMQSIKSPSVIQSVKSVISNKPLLLITLSDFLSGFAIKGREDDYYTDVLHFSSMTLVAGIPAAPISPLSYSWVPWMRERFSSRLLYILAKEIGNILYIPVFLFGCIGIKKDYSGGMYQKVVPMGFAMAIWEIIWTLFFGLKSVIGTEMYNEAMDYCEWKNGYRTEAMASVAKGIAAKISSNTSAVVTTALKKMIGYEADAFRTGTEQTDKVKFFLFAMFTIIPAVTGSLGIIPMLFYDLNNDKKERMYAELLARRNLMSATVASGNEDALEQAAIAQISVGESK
ncbi:MAG: MFS transporter [Clostridia bacterium]|nr:MFS transporter [Clostridia bacterium]